ncbi:hypothetical protein MD484_g514, partial [Candolleomyces efflorescens]
MIPLTALLSRLRTRKFLFLILIFSTLSLFLYTSALSSFVSDWSLLDRLPGFSGTNTGHTQSTCTPTEYNAGRWVWKPYYTRPGALTKSTTPTTANWTEVKEVTAQMQKNEDILEFARFGGCASSREYWWHFAVDRKEQWDRFPGAVEWEWVPGGRCSSTQGLREWKVEEVIRELVEGGGWLLIGDSVTENHFFSLSCLLYPHVLATPDYTKESSFDRAWPQHLYLNPSSPLLHTDSSTVRITKHQSGLVKPKQEQLRFPPSFDIHKTPLVTFRRNDLLFSKEELEDMHKELHPEFYSPPTNTSKPFSLFSEEPVWSIPPSTYLTSLFLAPTSHYRTLILSTAGHWTTNLFSGYKGPNPTSGEGVEEENLEDRKDGDPVYGYDGLVKFFGEVMQIWAGRVQDAFDEARAGEVERGLGRPYPPPPPPSSPHGVGVAGGEEPVNRMRERTAVVRAYLPGHEDCHEHRSAWQEVVPFKWNWWNWGEIGRYNQVFETLLSPNTSTTQQKKYKDVHYLPIDRPGRLRPDAHASGDCLHIMTGAGVLEGWSHYIWHYITREVSS